MSRRSILIAAGATSAALVASTPALAATPGLPASWDQQPRIPLWPKGTPETGFAAQPQPADYPKNFVRNVAQPELRVFVPARSNGQAVLSIPGGAYTFVSVINEGIDVARRMNALGYTVFVLIYRLPGEGWTHRADVPLQDAQRAVRVIRSRAAEYRLDPATLAVVGFSAGGHLAASLATGFGEAVAPVRDAIDRLDARPAHVGLIYPVISHVPGIGHADSSLKLLGPSPDAALIARRSPAEHVTAATPPIFLAHALDDPAVPAENSVIMMRAMQAAKRPVEAHFFQRGGHGFGTGEPDLPASAWPDLFLRWIADRVAAA
ncbi:alpha/beta hydrolase [Sphingomonas sp. LB2R24]|uniref:alpha/beta hydrolase n=1 Tax=Sphingomonas TaxID=13687 RepID=UPI0010E40C22|nr:MULTISPECIES: alpha/beta hydrolase [Sphingomonas]TCQ08485.1 acetyl esterase/lipase [Sphingomonas sp. PP-CC-3A-396]